MYATKADIIAARGEDILYTLAQDEHRGGIDDAMVQTALEFADRTIDTYLGRAYTLPLPAEATQALEYLRAVAIDLALPRLAGRRPGLMTDDLREGRKAAMDMLIAISEGRASLPGMTAAEGETGILTSGPARLFGRDKMRDL